VSIPHGATQLPAWCTRDLLVDPATLWSDWYTCELCASLAELGVTVVSAAWSRFVADVNRDPTRPVYAPFWEGIVASTDTQLAPIYRVEPSDAELRERIALAYEPFHAALDAAVASAVDTHGRALLLDLHSFGRDLPTDVILGDAHGTTASAATMARIEDAFVSSGLRVARNLVFSGGWIVRKFAGRPAPDAVQIELNQRCYLDPAEVDAFRQPPARDERRFATARALLADVIREIVGGW
jgi:N-formylglutamate deformylase